MTPAAILLLALAADPSPLAGKLAPIIAANKGQIAVVVRPLFPGGDAEYSHNANAVMPTASLIKLAVMVEAYSQADEKKTDLGKLLTLTREDRVPGAGILKYHFSDGATFPLKDAIRLMIVYSDNTATNMVLDQIGIKAVNARTAKLGLGETRINSKVYKRSTSSVDLPRSEKYGLGSTTANEAIKLLDMIHANTAASPAACETILGHLKANDDKEMLVRYLPEGTVVAHKTGAVSDARVDAGIIYVPDPADKKKTRPVAVCVLTNDNTDHRYVIDNAAQVTIANIGKAVYDHYAAAK